MASQMMQVNAVDGAVTKTLHILQLVLGEYHPRNFAVQLWDGSEWPAETEVPSFTLRLNHPGALRSIFQKTDLAVSEAYVRGHLDIEGDLEAAMPVGDFLRSRSWRIPTILRTGWDLFRLPAAEIKGERRAASLQGRLHSVTRDRQAVTYHYNVSNDFYALWLDRQMVYSCAYFEHADEELDTAQARKLDYLCRKLRLCPGDKLLDIGCGWGGLILHAAKYYGVTAQGITLSENQAKLASERIARAGLSNSCRVEVCDYRELKDPDGFNKIVSVGMFEHVGEPQLPHYFGRTWELLRPGGVFLNHGIARRVNDPPSSSSSFVEHYVFPDGGLAPVSTTIRCAEEIGFEVRDLESLREHYALTLRHWMRRLAAKREQALEKVGEQTYRVWQLFMSGSAHGFATGTLNVYQLLMVKPDDGRSGLPLTRADWYGGL
jgi:cyclopropane-fatty-acyl-phospholipid synthase